MCISKVGTILALTNTLTLSRNPTSPLPNERAFLGSISPCKMNGILPIPNTKLSANMIDKATKNPVIILHPSDPIEIVFSIR